MKLLAGPTALHRLTRIEQATGCGELWIKRDDLAGFGLAGNKTRALEHLLDDALTQGVSAFVTGGRAGSNFVAAAAQACASVSLPCHLVIAEWADTLALRLAARAGAQITSVALDELDDAIADRAAQLTERGARVYIAPRGGSSAVGAMGFADAVHELTTQLHAVHVTPEQVVVAVGTGGTLAGMCVGAAEVGATWTPYGVCVSHSTAEMAERIAALSEACSKLRAVSDRMSSWTRGKPAAFSTPVLRDATYPRGVLDTAEQAAADLALRLEGLLLDSTYTAKAFAAALRVAAAGSGPTVFWHTGGLARALGELPPLPQGVIR